MKTKYVVLPLLASLAPVVFADDAMVLPAGVIRTTIAPSYTTINESFDADGEREDSSEIAVTTMSLALEYGVTDWLTAGLQWAPGYSLAGETDVDGLGTVDLTGAYDLFAGAKVQLIGDTGFAQFDNVRLTVTPGIKVPTSSYDTDEEVERFSDGDAFRAARTDRGAWGLGGRISFDYQVTEDLYFNLFNQTTVFLESTQDYDAVTQLLGGQPMSDVDVKYGTELVFEGEANYSLPEREGMLSSIGLPVTYVTAGETELEGNGLDDASYSLAVSPYASVFFTDWTLPMEFKLGYSAVVAGENADVENTVTLEIKNFLSF